MLKKSLQHGLEDRLLISQMSVTVALERKSNSIFESESVSRVSGDSWRLWIPSGQGQVVVLVIAYSVLSPLRKFPEMWIVTYFVSI